MTHTPRRAGARWREGAPDWVLDCMDNGGTSADRYTVMFAPPVSPEGYVFYMAMSASPSHPQGVGMSGEMRLHEAAAYRYRCGKHRVTWASLPEAVRACAARFATED